MSAKPCFASICLLAAMIAIGSHSTANAQPDRDREDPEFRDRDRDDVPKAEVRKQDRDRDEPQEGYEEGVPGASKSADEGRFRIRPVGWRLGVYARNTDTGVLITRVIRGMPAARVGLEPGDVIVTVDGYQVGYVKGRLYSLGDELQRRAGHRGQVTLLVQNVRNLRLVNIDAQLEGEGPPYRQRD